MKSERLLLISLLVGILAGCGGKGPQHPSQRKGSAPKVDSTQLVLMELNQQLALAADEQLSQIVKAQVEPYALYERGVWATILDQGDTARERPQEGDECTVHMRIYSLSGQLYSDIEQVAKVGQHEWPEAIDENISEWHYDARIRMFAPWYSAYGLQGTETIPPYENVIIEIEIK